MKKRTTYAIPVAVCRLLLLLLLTASYSEATFDFGDGCEGGSGRFILNLPQKGDKTLVGYIPSGKWNVRVHLTAQTDVDVQLYDTQDTAQFPTEGKAIVAWCENAQTCNIGALGSDEGEKSTSYRNMSVSYSGYNGIDGQSGKEWIRITGETTRQIAMYAFAFEAGNAVVEYNFDRVQTACCLGVAACGGSFAAPIAQNSVVNIGEIPVGKKNLRVTLTSPADVDIQLYDLDDAGCAASGGKAIIAYTETTSTCGTGALGNNDGTPESTTYPTNSNDEGRLYEYSGYYGGQTADTYGNEYVVVNGVSNRRLMMKAFGYAAGNANVEYTYFEDYDVNDASNRIPPAPSVVPR